MKLYLLRIEDRDGVDIQGLYSSKEKAIESFPFNANKLSEEDIEEIEVDPPNGPERYETYFCAIAHTDGSICALDPTFRMTRMEAESPHYSWDSLIGLGRVTVFAPSPEEARAKAEKYLPTLHPVWQVGRSRDGHSPVEARHSHPSCVYARWPRAYAVHEDLDTARQILTEYETTGRVLPGLVVPADSTKEEK